MVLLFTAFAIDVNAQKAWGLQPNDTIQNQNAKTNEQLQTDSTNKVQRQKGLMMINNENKKTMEYLPGMKRTPPSGSVMPERGPLYKQTKEEKNNSEQEKEKPK